MTKQQENEIKYWSEEVIMNLALAMMCHPSQSNQATRMINLWRNAYGGYIDTFQLWKVDLTQEKEEVRRNKMLVSLKDFDYVLTIDSDEWILRKDFEVLYNSMRGGAIDIYQFTINDWISTSELMEPKREHLPVVAVRPGRVKFFSNRCPDAKGMTLKKIDAPLQHLVFLHDQEFKRENYRARGMSEEEMKIWDNAKTRDAFPDPELVEVMAELTGGGG